MVQQKGPEVPSGSFQRFKKPRAAVEQSEVPRPSSVSALQGWASVVSRGIIVGRYDYRTT